MKRSDLKKLINELGEDLKTQFNSIVEGFEKSKRVNRKIANYEKQFEDKKNVIDSPESGLLAKLNSLKEKINSPETGLDATILKANKTKEDIGNIHSDVQAQRDASRDTTKEIEGYKEASYKDAQRVEELRVESSKVKESIDKVYKLATDMGLAGSFASRATEINKTTKWWLALIVLAVGLLFWAIGSFVYPLLSANGSNITTGLFLRLTLTSPAVFLIVFATVQYSKERTLLEKYSFKAATALALESYTELLGNTFTDKKHKEQILKFVLQAVNNIYKEPHSEPKKYVYRFGMDGQFAKMKAEIVEEVAEKISSTQEENEVEQVGGKGE